MKKITTFLVSLGIFIFFMDMDIQAQGFLRKAVQKLQKEAEKMVDDDEVNDAGEQPDHMSLMVFNNSPMLAMVNSFLTNPLFMNSADDSQKVIRVSGYKGLLAKQIIDDEHVGYEVQIPFGQSLLTFNCERINKESLVMSYLEKIDIKGIARLAGGN